MKTTVSPVSSHRIAGTIEARGRDLKTDTAQTREQGFLQL